MFDTVKRTTAKRKPGAAKSRSTKPKAAKARKAGQRELHPALNRREIDPAHLLFPISLPGVIQERDVKGKLLVMNTLDSRGYPINGLGHLKGSYYTVTHARAISDTDNLLASHHIKYLKLDVPLVRPKENVASVGVTGFQRRYTRSRDKPLHG